MSLNNTAIDPDFMKRRKSLVPGDVVVIEDSVEIVQRSNLNKSGERNTSWSERELVDLFLFTLTQKNYLPFKKLCAKSNVHCVPCSTFSKRMTGFCGHDSLRVLKEKMDLVEIANLFTRSLLEYSKWTQFCAEGRAQHLTEAQECAVSAMLVEFGMVGASITYDMFQAWVLAIAEVVGGTGPSSAWQYGRDNAVASAASHGSSVDKEMSIPKVFLIGEVTV